MLKFVSKLKGKAMGYQAVIWVILNCSIINELRHNIFEHFTMYLNGGS